MKLYDTLSGTIKELPSTDGLVKIYACGVTTYDEIHLGHARQAIVFDVLKRYLQYRGVKVLYVRNYTDIDDKIINRAKIQRQDFRSISDYYIDRTKKDLAALDVKPADYEPKVTDHIGDIINFISGLIEKGAAYVQAGEVLYSVDSFPEYGKLSHRKVQELVSTDDTPNKRQPYDFSLWKPAKDGEPFWESPWGPGRPGWHIECSVLADHYLGETIDIHGGGLDLVFPHHENEIAQSEALHRKPLARLWMHNGLVLTKGTKMSKSLGNYATVKDLLTKYTADEIRFTIISHHYQSPMQISDKMFIDARKRLYYFYKTLTKIDQALPATSSPQGSTTSSSSLIDIEADFNSAMDDNLNTAKVIANLSNAFTAVNKLLEQTQATPDRTESLRSFRQAINTIASVLRILNEPPPDYISALTRRVLDQRHLTAELVTEKIAQRQQAKAGKDYATADAIRDELRQWKIEIQDTATRSDWGIIFD